MFEMSPTAEATWDAAWEHTPVDYGNAIGTRRRQVAAALRAAARGSYLKSTAPADQFAAGWNAALEHITSIAHELAPATDTSS